MVAKYKVLRFIGVPLVQDKSGNYQIKKDNNGNFKLHEWRIGKHTKGDFKSIGQVFLTENQMRVCVLKAYDVPFKKRHEYTPMARFLNDYVNESIIDEANFKVNNPNHRS